MLYIIVCATDIFKLEKELSGYNKNYETDTELLVKPFVTSPMSILQYFS